MTQMIPGERLRFVLSTGRTGTVFLSRTLPTIEPGWEVEHEPAASRRIFMLRNAADHGVIGVEALARRLFIASRRRSVASVEPGRVRIEVNPFLGPIASVLPDLVAPLHVVHMVRDPRTWIVSMSNFRASGWRRHVIDAVPFARPVHPLVRRKWLMLSRLERHAWWWRRTNENILEIAAQAASFRTVRYEDLFLGDEETRRGAMAQVMEGLGGRPQPSALPIPGSVRVNPGRTGRTPAWSGIPVAEQRKVLDVVGPLMGRFGYEP